jgi:tetratricopeptide (TPR) repeat protein
MRDVSERFVRSEGERHPDTIVAKNNLAYALLHAGHFDEAERVFREALQSVAADDNLSNIAMAQQNLAATLGEEGRFAEAIALDKESVALQERREGKVSGNVAVALRSLAAAEESRGEGDAAEKDFRAALAMGETLRQARKVGQTYEWKIPLADLLAGRERCDEALPLLREAQDEIALATAHAGPIWGAEARLLNGHCLAATRRPGGAEMERAARAELNLIPTIQMDLYPTARKLLEH